jgi:uncharacterized membrane protein YfcA
MVMAKRSFIIRICLASAPAQLRPKRGSHDLTGGVLARRGRAGDQTMSTLALWIAALTIPATSFISGIFGMAGGMILLGVLLLVMDVAPAMILFGATQAAANGWRAILWWRNIDWGIVWRFLIGAAIVFVILRWISLFPNKAWLYIALGLAPFLADLLPKQLIPDITRPAAPYICGAIVMAMTLLAGVAAALLDMFYQKSNLDRRVVVATKAVTQTAGHLARILYFDSFASGLAGGLPWWVFIGAIALAMAGTTAATRLLEGMSNESFRQWSKRLIQAISIVYVARGIWLVASGN